jgi:hypothetical protein
MKKLCHSKTFFNEFLVVGNHISNDKYYGQFLRNLSGGLNLRMRVKRCLYRNT